MLICKNCNTENTDDAQVCNTCKMRGSQNFIYVASRQAAPNNDASSVSNRLEVVCWNCSKPAGDGEKCPHCNIKLKKKEVVKLTVSKKMVDNKTNEETNPSPTTASKTTKSTQKKIA